MSALSRLITKCTKRQLQIATTVDEISTILDRTIAFAEAEKPYISDEEIDELIPYVPVTEPAPEPETDSGAPAVDDGTNATDAF
jgi:hypothetical protein